MKVINVQTQQISVDGNCKENVLYRDNNIVIIESIRDIDLIDEKFIVEGYIVSVVKKGHSSLHIDEQIYQFEEGDAFICAPRNIIENAMVSMDFDMYGMLVSPEYAQQIICETNIEIPPLTQQRPFCIHMSDNEKLMVRQYYELLTRNFLKPESQSRQRTLTYLMQACAMELFALFNRMEGVDMVVASYTSAELIFQRFIAMLHNSEKPILSVKEYANLLNITPKYFSTVCKQVSGRTASDIIKTEIINTARIMLRDPRYSIKQIAIFLGFANQSHFGTFVRRHTGMSPNQLRTKL